MTSVVNVCCDCSEGRMDQSAESGPGCQDVNPHFLQQLRELDIPEEAAKQVRWCLQMVTFTDPSVPQIQRKEA